MDVKQLPCADCKYPGFNGLVLSCRHPAHPVPIAGKRTLQILGTGGKCAQFVDCSKKAMDQSLINWPLPVSFTKERNDG